MTPTVADGTPVSVRSTRATENTPPTSLDDAILRGLAPDGGLYLPSTLPVLPPGWMDAPSPGDLAADVLAPWWGRDAAHEVAPLLRDAFDVPLPVRRLDHETWLLETFHGPTASFKDFGARTMARLAGRALRARGRTATVLVATSGDTGSAVADGFSGIEGVDVVLLYPFGMVSDVQERQLALARPGVRAYAVDGDFDACQRMVKQAFADPDLRRLGITSANSINVGRLLPQMIYYLWGVARLQRDEGVDAPPWIVVPSGNLGNVTAGMMAAATSMPAAGFVAAHNANPFLSDVLAGRRLRHDRPATIATVSNAMDVGSPSNFERLDAWLGDDLGGRVRASTTDDHATLARMTSTWTDHGVLVCPHTAVGLEAASRGRDEGWLQGPALVVATADPAKFPQAVERATGMHPPSPPWLTTLMRGEKRVTHLPSTDEALKAVLMDRPRRS